MNALLGVHPASILAAAAIVGVGFKLLQVRFRKGEHAFSEKGLWAAIASGVLLVNGLAHFTHGVSGDRFPAPFGYLIGSGLPSNISNVLWGFFNLVLGYYLFKTGKVFGADRRKEIAFFAGALGMGLLLAFIFSHRQ